MVKLYLCFKEFLYIIDREECKRFFQIINSKEYKKSLKELPVQYLLKVGHGAHQSAGVFILDDKETIWVNKEYQKGERCGEETMNLLSQTYITNPLLLDRNNKFDFRVYMLISSTNPLIAYYHDGFLRVSLNSFDKTSADVRIFVYIYRLLI